MFNSIEAASQILKLSCDSKELIIVLLMMSLIWADRKVGLIRIGNWLWKHIKKQALRKGPWDFPSEGKGHILYLWMTAIGSSCWMLLYLALIFFFMGACLLAIARQPPFLLGRIGVGLTCIIFCAFWARYFFVDFQNAVDKIDRFHL